MGGKLQSAIEIAMQEKNILLVERFSARGIASDEALEVKDQIIKAFNYVLNMAKEIEKNKQKNNFKLNYFNEEHANIISILGERGSGKSSVLISLKKILKEESQNIEYANDSYTIKNCLFLPNLIDPSVIEDCGSILTLIISLLFKGFDEMESSLSEDERRKIVNKFIKLSEIISILDNRSKTNDALDDLLSNTEVYNISTKLEELIDNYLELKSKNAIYKQLVIVIDDIDLNQKGCYKMLEELRKYFCLTNVIVVISASLRDLTNVVSSYFNDNYKSNYDFIVYQQVVSSKNKNDIYNYNLEQLTKQYLVKVLPYPLRINININQDKYINYILNSYEEIGFYLGNFSKGATRIFLPENMRGIIQFVYELERTTHKIFIIIKYFLNNLRIYKKYTLTDNLIDLNCILNFKNNDIKIFENLKKQLKELLNNFDFNEESQVNYYKCIYICFIYKRLIDLSNERANFSLEVNETFNRLILDVSKLYTEFFEKNDEILIYEKNNDYGYLFKDNFHNKKIKNENENLNGLNLLDIIEWKNIEGWAEKKELNLNLNNLLNNLIIYIRLKKLENKNNFNSFINELETLRITFGINIQDIRKNIESNNFYNKYVKKNIPESVLSTLRTAIKDKTAFSSETFELLFKQIYLTSVGFDFELYEKQTIECKVGLYQMILREIKDARKYNNKSNK